MDLKNKMEDYKNYLPDLPIFSDQKKPVTLNLNAKNYQKVKKIIEDKGSNISKLIDLWFKVYLKQVEEVSEN